MNSITVYYCSSDGHIAERLRNKAPRPRASIAFGQCYVAICKNGTSQPFEFQSVAHSSVNKNGKYKPLGDPEIDLFNEEGKPLRSMFKTVKGIVTNIVPSRFAALLSIQVTEEQASAALAFALETQKKPPLYQTAHSNCAVFSSNVMRAAGFDLAMLSNKTRIRNPSDMHGAFKAVASQLVSVKPDQWEGTINGVEVKVVNQTPGLFDGPQRRVSPSSSTNGLAVPSHADIPVLNPGC